MKTIYTILILLILLSSKAQVQKIKIKKNTTMENTSIVTIAGLQKGEISLTALCSNRKLKISNSHEKSKIIFFIATVGYNDFITECANPSDSLIDGVMKLLLYHKKNPKTVKLAITKITALSGNKDTLKLNDIWLTVKR